MSTVIKKGQAGRLVHKMISLDLADHLAEADRVVAGARRQARQIIEAAKTEGQRLFQQAREEGYRDGAAKGREQGREQGQTEALAEARERFEAQQGQLAAALEMVLREIEQRKRDLMIQANRDVLVFAVELAKKVTQGVGRLDSGVARANVEQALRLVGQRSNVSVRINPQDADTLRQFASELTELADGAAHLSIVEDATLAPGDAVIEAGVMEIDARLETQIGQLATVLLG
ncbi:MAG: FliH/SctL family protein [Phycisphaerae bacterium]